MPAALLGMPLLLAALAFSARDTTAAAAATGAHLHWSSSYDTDFPAMRGWVNMGLTADQFAFPAGSRCAAGVPGPTGCGLRAKLAAWEQFQMTSFYDLCDHPQASSSPLDITNASSPWSEDGACAIWNRGAGLLDGWEVALERQVATQIMPHFGSGKALRGVSRTPLHTITYPEPLSRFYL